MCLHSPSKEGDLVDVPFVKTIYAMYLSRVCSTLEVQLLAHHSAAASPPIRLAAPPEQIWVSGNESQRKFGVYKVTIVSGKDQMGTCSWKKYLKPMICLAITFKRLAKSNSDQRM